MCQDKFATDLGYKSCTIRTNVPTPSFNAVYRWRFSINHSSSHLNFVDGFFFCIFHIGLFTMPEHDATFHMSQPKRKIARKISLIVLNIERMVRLDITFMSCIKAEHREWPFLSPRMAFLKMSKVIFLPPHSSAASWELNLLIFMNSLRTFQ